MSYMNRDFMGVLCAVIIWSVVMVHLMFFALKPCLSSFVEESLNTHLPRSKA